MLFVDLVVWGLLVVFMASKLLARTREPIALDLMLCGAAVLIAGIVYVTFGVAGLTLYTILAASTGAILLIAGFRAVPDRLPAKTPGWRGLFEAGSFSQRWSRWREYRSPDQKSLETWEGEGGAAAAVPPQHKA